MWPPTALSQGQVANLSSGLPQGDRVTELGIAGDGGRNILV